jgi:L,D-peptidoglycan transpeptidase YkuD (ErfK/YbiS/YcfS/YnhG family)
VQKGDACEVGRKAARQKAPQVVVVRSSGTRATVLACTRGDDGRYAVSLKPMAGWVGRNGVAPKGRKREGDGRTPGGTFPLGRGFGHKGDPGLRHRSWLRVDDRDVWVDDPTSRLYNRHARLPARGRWSSAERLKIRPYAYAQVIGYNRKRTPYRGSAIFLHVSIGEPTAGCVSLPQRRLLRLLRWQRAGVVMVIR